MASYPTCVRCLGTESELDLEGVCTTCHSRGSKKETSIIVKKPAVAELKTIQVDATRTGLPDNSIGLVTTAPYGVRDQRPPAPVPVGHFANYIELEYLDRGGMGIVYKAVQVKTGRVVALKTMNAIAHSDSRQERRFKIEGQALARLSHPGIVQIYDVDEENGLAFFAMEYVSGGSLAKRLKNGDRPDPKESARLMAGIASALAAAHARKIVHRDIKPSNILITDAEMPKLTDFGLAAFFDQSARMTNTGAMIGTPAYMSPEQAEGRFGQVGPLSDVYSLGATLYELLTGRPPFAAETPVATAIKVCKEAVVKPRSIDPAVPAELESICLKCLEKRPADRYPGAAALANDLTRFLRGEPIGKTTVGYKVRRFVRRNRKGLIAAGLILAFGLAAAIILDRTKVTPNEIASKQFAALLGNGKEAVLVGPTGLPKYFRWAEGTGNLKTRNETTLSDNVALLESPGAPEFSLLELCPDTVVDQFHFEAEIQHVSVYHQRGRTGLYLMARDADQVKRWISFDYTDFTDVPDDEISAFQGLDARALIRDTLTIHQPAGPNSDIKYLTSLRYVHGTSSPRKWRKVSIDVRRGGIVGVFDGLDPMKNKGALSVRLELTREALVKREGDVVQYLANSKDVRPGQHYPTIPYRAAVGIFANESHVAFRNVKITPLPQP